MYMKGVSNRRIMSAVKSPVSGLWQKPELQSDDKIHHFYLSITLPYTIQLSLPCHLTTLLAIVGPPDNDTFDLRIEDKPSEPVAQLTCGGW